MPRSTIFTGSSGQNTIVDPSELDYDHKTGISELAVSNNVVIGNTGRVGRVPTALTKVQDLTQGHSLFSEDGPCFVAQGTDLYTVGTNLSLTGIRNNLSGDQISYAQDAEKTWYANGTQNGLVVGGLSYDWPVDTYHGPETTEHFSAAPIGHHIALAMSRMFIARDDIISWSEVFKYGLYMAKHHIRLRSKCIMLKPVVSGFFASDLEKTYFFRGDDPSSLKMETVANFPAYEWSDAHDTVEGADVGVDSGLCVMWNSPKGAFLGTSTGKMIPITRSKIIYPNDGQAGASLVRGYDLIHTTI